MVRIPPQKTAVPAGSAAGAAADRFIGNQGSIRLAQHYSLIIVSENP